MKAWRCKGMANDMDKKKILIISIVVVILLITLTISMCSSNKGKASEKKKEALSSEEAYKSVENSQTKKNNQTKESSKAQGNNQTDKNTETGESEETTKNGVESSSKDNNEKNTDEEFTTSIDENAETTKPSNSVGNTGNENLTVENNNEVESKIEETTTKKDTTVDNKQGESEDIVVVPSKTHSPATMRNITTMQLVADMGIGINLGNTFESCGDWINSSSVKNYETGWGSPVITKAMIQGMAAEGFETIRIPVAWSNMMGADYTIKPAYMARVKEVTDWALECDMYVIINIHWDGGWWESFPTDKEECMRKYKAIWTQIAYEFCDYGDKLIFESLNEEGCWDSLWNRYGGATAGKATAYDLLNEINQTFVDVVRGSSCNNAKRHLLIAGYATDIPLTCDSYFKMPNDSAGRCAVSVHYYTPSAYTILTEDADWAKAQTEWGSESDIAELNKYMKMMYDNFVSKGVPVIIGEFGLPAMANKTKENAILYLRSVAETAYNYGMCPVLWDTTSEYSFYNRYTCSMSGFQSLKEAFLNIVK